MGGLDSKCGRPGLDPRLTDASELKHTGFVVEALPDASVAGSELELVGPVVVCCDRARHTITWIGQDYNTGTSSR